MFDDEGGAVVFLASFAAKVSASALQLGKIGSPTMDRRLHDVHSSSWSSQIPSQKRLPSETITKDPKFRQW